MHRCLHGVVHGRVGEDGFVVEQVALCVEAHHLAARAETGVDAHHALLSERCVHQQLVEVLREHVDSLLVGLLLAQRGKFRLDARFQQSFVTVLDGLVHQRLAFAVTADIVALQPTDALFVVGLDIDAQDTFLLTAAHGQQTVTGTAFQRFFPVEIVRIFRSLIGVLFCFHHLGADECIAAERLSHLIAATLILTDLFGDDVLGSLQCHFHILNVAFHEAFSGFSRVWLTLHHEDGAQWFQSLLSCHLCPCTPFRFVGQVDVLQFRSIPAVVDTLLQFRCHFVKFRDSLDHGLLTFGDFRQLFAEGTDLSNLHLVESASAFLSVS